jgi:beta-1,2-mannobiose phosphorylase / 1,2-beta-oligomannan phosphorylase
MSSFDIDRLVFGPTDVDLARSPLAGKLAVGTHVLGAFNPALTRLDNGNLLMVVRIAEALDEPVRDGAIHAIRWTEQGYALDAWPLDQVDPADPRKFTLNGGPWRVMALTSLSWLLPVELSPDGLTVVDIHYDRAVAPAGSWQCYGVEDARISKVDGRWLMTTCSVSPERHCTTLYASEDALDWRFEQGHGYLRRADRWRSLGADSPLGRSVFRLPPGQRMAGWAIDQPCDLA